MTTAPESEITVRYEGGSVGTELWGMTQANFIVHLPGRHEKETAVMLNDAAARYLAETLGEPDTPEFRAAAARQAGQFLLEQRVSAGHVDSLVTLSRAVLDEHPEILEHLKRTRI